LDFTTGLGQKSKLAHTACIQGQYLCFKIKAMDIHHVLRRIVQQDQLHAKWLNTLSFMENAGARKISQCEHPTKVGIIQLKHAAEEHRHAYYLKKQIGKLSTDLYTTYDDKYLIAPRYTKQYLHQLDIKSCRYLKETFNLSGTALKYAAYLFVTYAIEVRADQLYPIYQHTLDLEQSKVMVKSIIVEEEGHLEEMTAQLQLFSPHWKRYAEDIQAIEQVLYKEWISAIGTYIN
jgi:bacterioferritin (cytochrome b1)